VIKTGHHWLFEVLAAALWVILLVPGMAQASWNAGNFYKFGVGSRPFGMGDAFAAVADDATAVYWNPAGLVNVPPGQFFVSYANRFGLELQEQSAGATFRIQEKHYFGVAIVRAGLGDIKRSTSRDGDNRPIVDGTFDNSQINLTVSTAMRIHDLLSFGLSGKYYGEALDGNSAHGFGFDVGWLFHPRQNLSVGFNGQNLNRPRMKWDTGTGHYDRIPANLKLGGSALFFSSQLLVTADLNAPDFERVLLNSGAEYQLMANLRMRAGFSGDQPGAGLSINVGQLRFDYGFRSHDLGDTHRISLLATI